MEQPTITVVGAGRSTNDDSISSEGTPRPFSPTEQWIRQYQRQATPQLISGLNQYARTRALAVADSGRKVDDYYARELVLDALGDTWLGVVRWDPTKCSLGYHLVRTIEGRSDKHRKHAEKRPHDTLDDNTDESRAAEANASKLVGCGHDVADRLIASETMRQVRALATDDKPLVRILDAYDAGCETKADVLAHARMKDRTYRSAFARLRRILRQLADRKLAAKRHA